MTPQQEAQKLVDYCLNLLSIQYNSDGVVMTRSRCLPKAKMIARSHISFLIAKGGFATDRYDYWLKVQDQIERCI